MVLIRESSGAWSCTVAATELPLREGMRLRVDPAVLGRPPVLDGSQELICRLQSWEYHVLHDPTGDTLQLELLVVEEARPLWFVAWFDRQYARLSPDNQVLVPILSVIVVFALTGAVAFTLYLQPLHGLSFVGRHIRASVGWMLAVLFLGVLPSRLGLLNQPQSFRKNFFYAFMNFTGYALIALWLTFSARPPGFGGSDQECADYARHLGSALSRSYWPLLVAALPWLSMGFKLVGLDFAEKASEGLEKVVKKSHD
jgi:hypothetical protein